MKWVRLFGFILAGCSSTTTVAENPDGSAYSDDAAWVDAIDSMGNPPLAEPVSIVQISIGGGGKVCAGSECGRDGDELRTAPGTLLTATPDPGWEFAGWFGHCDSNDCVTVVHHQIAGARFAWTGQPVATVDGKVHQIVATPRGALVVGRFSIQPSESFVTMAEFSEDGDLLWSRDLGHTATAAAMDETGRVVLSGVLPRDGVSVDGVEFESRGGTDVLLSIVSAPAETGDVRTSQFGGPYSDGCAAVDTHEGLGYAACRVTSSLVLVVEEAGSFREHPIGGVSRTPSGLVADPEGGFFVSVSGAIRELAGHTFPDGGSGDGFVIRIEADWSVDWARAYGGSGRSVTNERDDFISGVARDPRTGDLFIAGRCSGEVDIGSVNVVTPHRNAAFVARISPTDGTARWVEIFGRYGSADGRSVATEGGLMFTGHASNDQTLETQSGRVRLENAHEFVLTLNPETGQLVLGASLPQFSRAFPLPTGTWTVSPIEPDDHFQLKFHPRN